MDREVGAWFESLGLLWCLWRLCWECAGCYKCWGGRIWLSGVLPVPENQSGGLTMGA